jgi:hypothetical protein
MQDNLKKTINTGTSLPVTSCQSCGYDKLYSILFLGYLPPVNTMPSIGTVPTVSDSFPANLLEEDIPKIKLNRAYRNRKIDMR